jgi:hypothetical protein
MSAPIDEYPVRLDARRATLPHPYTLNTRPAGSVAPDVMCTPLAFAFVMVIHFVIVTGQRKGKKDLVVMDGARVYLHERGCYL